MPRAEAGTPKAIANAIKAKGLQKLMFFCQMCQKQCRDANGFKCHINSEAHQRQLLLVSEDPNRFVEDYSKEFLRDFMQLFRTRYGSRRVYANDIYQEYIKDRYHVHMNSTRWLSLGAFVQWLGRKGYATVDRTEKGWYVTYIDRDPETLKREENLKKKGKIEKDYEERMSKVIQEQVQRGRQTEMERSQTKNGDDDHDHDKERGGEEEEEEKEDGRKNELVRSTEEKIVLKLNLNKNDKKPTPITAMCAPSSTSTISKGEDRKPISSSTYTADHSDRKRQAAKRDQSPTNSRKRSALDEIIREESERKFKQAKRQENWIREGIVVKVMSEKLPEKYYKKKGHIVEVKDKFLAVVKMLDSGAVIKLDQAHLEPVIPREGNLIRVVNGAYRGEKATLLDVNVEKLRAIVKLESGSYKGKRVEDLLLDDICKIHTP